MKNKFSIPSYNLAKISAVTAGELSGKENVVVRELVTDSRNYIVSGNSLFVALRGVRHDGHTYLGELAERGLQNFLVEYVPDSLKERNDLNFIVVPDTFRALQQLATFHRSQFTMPVTGITGSNGKTIVKEWLFQLLNADRSVLRSPRSYNSQIGVPLSVWKLSSAYDLAIFEAGISMPGEMQRLKEIIDPDIGIFTNIGQAHQENFSSPGEKVDEKLKLFADCETIIICSDHLEVLAGIERAGMVSKSRFFTWSTKAESATVYASEIVKKEGKTHFSVKYNNIKTNVEIPFSDAASFENAMHCFSFLLLIGYSPGEIAVRMKSLVPVAMRLEQKQGINNCTLINDAYNSDIVSLEIALDFLNQQRQHPRKTVILSDIFQSGMSNEQLYKEVATLLEGKKIHRLIGVGKGLSSCFGLFREGSLFFDDTEDLMRQLGQLQFSNEAILLKGARSFEFERISAQLEKKTHNTVLEINLDSLIHNLNSYRSLLNNGTRVMAMVKAFSYGSGTWEIANILQHQKVDYLGVAFADEGMELRRAGIRLPMMVMNPEETGFDQMIEHELEPEIYSFRVLKKWAEELNSRGISDYPVHLKIDSGMHRLGFLPEDAEDLISFLQKNRCFSIRSVFSHLAASDEPQHDEFTRKQIKTFDVLSKKIQQELKYPVIRHILNSAGIERFPEAHYDMVRLGIGLYGITSDKQLKLQQVSSLKSIISQIKVIEPGESVGYSRNFKAESSVRVGVVPVGYADGLDRRLGNGNGKFFIHGQEVSIIGNICMDMCMINLTGINAQEGDEIIIFGEEFTISDISKKTGTIPYEVLTGISSRVKRVYFRE
ncbi:MAG TPA: bifunctional UDP-N-acetylmuramoyl-tripeptide:D-alanyl-D-alanine ligase/alanine racemase [Bacteroidales bacterium]|nr:bifunctional UDP-N-acetylmuramoyl-tripeptide:D-alanyl-D-alanine ligase/alanine racemase [Bacteroidales bacterium]